MQGSVCPELLRSKGNAADHGLCTQQKAVLPLGSGLPRKEKKGRPQQGRLVPKPVGTLWGPPETATPLCDAGTVHAHWTVQRSGVTAVLEGIRRFVQNRTLALGGRGTHRGSPRGKTLKPSPGSLGSSLQKTGLRGWLGTRLL